MAIISTGMAVLFDLIETEGRQAVLAELYQARWTTSFPIDRIFGHLAYLFYGRAKTAPQVWVAGAVTHSGRSVTGSGRSQEAALLGVAGEIAEFETREQRPLLGEGSLAKGYGAHPVRQCAIDHARYEVMERFYVMQWWRGLRCGVLWDQVNAAQIRSDAPMADRTPLVFDVARAEGASVVIVASFDKNGMGFCFGAACRANDQLAAMAAANELAQAEVGLYLAEMKHQRFGAERLSAADHVALNLAKTVSRDVVLSNMLVRTNGPRKGDLTHRDISFADTSIRDIGLFEEHFHVVEAHSNHAEISTNGDASGPYANLQLY